MAFFIHSQAATFHQVVTKIEGENISAVEVSNEVIRLKENLEKRKESIFLPIMMKSLIKNLESDGLIKLDDVKDIVSEFYKTCIDYLDQWSGDLEELNHMQWALLKNVPNWQDVENTFESIVEKKLFDPEYHSELFDNFACASSYGRGPQTCHLNSDYSNY